MFSDARKAIIGAIVLALVGGTGGLLYLSKTLLDFSIAIATMSTPLWATILLFLLFGLYSYLKLRQHQHSYKPPNIQEELREAFGVYWNDQYKLRCLRCRWPLKCASKNFDSSVFFCSKCDTKYALRDKNGNHLTETQAIEQLKMCQQFNSGDG